MGQVIKRQSKKGWRFYLKYVDLDGTRRTRAVKHCETEEEALEELKVIEVNVRQGRMGIAAPPKPDPEAERRKTITVREIGAEFGTRYSDRTDKRKKKDVVAYRKRTLRLLEKRIYGTLGDRAAASVTKRDVIGLVDALGEGDDAYAESSLGSTINTLSKVYGWAIEERLIDCANPCAKIRRDAGEDKGPITSEKYLSKEEAQNLLVFVQEQAASAATPETAMLATMIAVGLYAGLRKGELLGLRWPAVDLERNQIEVSRSYDGKTKSSKTRFVPVGPRLATILRAWKTECPKTDKGRVFPVAGNEDDLGDSWQMFGLEQAMRSAGCHVPPKAWHALRHSFASHFIMSGGNVVTLQRLLGHAKIETTVNIYSHLAPDFMAAEVARLDFSRPLPADVADIAEARAKKIMEQLERDPEVSAFLRAALELGSVAESGGLASRREKLPQRALLDELASDVDAERVLSVLPDRLDEIQRQDHLGGRRHDELHRHRACVRIETEESAVHAGPGRSREPYQREAPRRRGGGVALKLQDETS
jgi:integrase